MVNDPEISIIIPTFKRKNSTIRLLYSLLPQLTENYEVIIVEQHKNNNKYYRNVLSKFKERYKYIFIKQSSTPIAKNIGVKNASSQYLLFLDDDVTVHDDLISHHIASLNIKNVGGVAGRVITPGTKIEYNNKKVGKITLLGKFTDGYSSTVKQEVDTVIGCNASWRKDVFYKVGGFDENYTGNAMREESDLSLKVKQLGYRILFDPKACVTHHREEKGGNRKTEGRLKWYFHFFSNETYFYLKFKPKLLLPLMLFTRWEWAMRCMFGFGRELSFNSLLTPIKGIIDGYKKYKSL